MSAKTLLTELLQKADIEVNGARPWDIAVHDERLFSRIRWWGILGLGEAYMDGWWDVEQLDEFIFRLVRVDERRRSFTPWKLAPWFIMRHFDPSGSLERAFRIGTAHYDIGNDLFQAMLDKRMVYTCGYWKEATTLDQAQEAKLDLVCRKLDLKPGMSVLDIGCGWGSFLKYAAEKYGVTGVGITVSKEQAALAREQCSGLPVEIRIEDYRQTQGMFDRVVSLGMFEHVGYKHYREYLKQSSVLLKDEGLFLLHTIGNNYSAIVGEPWSDRYIFPGGMLPSIKQIGAALEGVLIMEDWQNFGPDYARTLLAWHENFVARWKQLEKKYDERFYRMWRYYLLSFSGAFRGRSIQLWQIVLSKNRLERYDAVR